ncbi:MAG: restriction endonuclease subunit S [Pirellulaceae bacterium]
MRLGEVAEIRGGLVAGTGANPLSPEAIRALQVGDLASDGTIPWQTLRRAEPTGNWKRSLIQEGDLLIPLRSTRVTAIVARGVAEQTIAVGHWAIISTGPGLLPEYLAWFLAHPSNAKQWRQAEVGSKLAFVPLSAVREMNIEVPSLEIQRRIANVEALHHRITELETQLAHARYQYVHQLTRTALGRAMHSNH